MKELKKKKNTKMDNINCGKNIPNQGVGGGPA